MKQDKWPFCLLKCIDKLSHLHQHDTWISFVQEVELNRLREEISIQQFGSSIATNTTPISILKSLSLSFRLKN